MLSWRYDFFVKGHTMSDIDELSYWDFIEITKYQNHTVEKQSGKTTYKKLQPSQKQMIKERKVKEARRKEGKK